MASISEGEVAVYDRQLRLWGVQAQGRLMKAKALIWGLEGSNVELCKNLVLAGVSLVVRDHREVNPSDINFNYFLRKCEAGKNRAECAAVRIQEMNPLSSVVASTAAPEDANALVGALKGYDIVCVSLGVLGFDVDLARAVDAACREVQAGFFITLSAGELSFFFADLGEHTVQEKSSAQGGGAGSTAQSDSNAAIENLSYPSFKEWLECTPASLQRQKADASFVVVALFLAFMRSSGKGCCGDESGTSKFAAYCNSEKCSPTVDGYENVKDVYPCFFVEPLMHVASIIGGLLAQEVIKAITKRDVPLSNCVCFNAHTSAALVERIPAAPKSPPKKRKLEEEQIEEL